MLTPSFSSYPIVFRTVVHPPYRRLLEMAEAQLNLNLPALVRQATTYMYDSDQCLPVGCVRPPCRHPGIAIVGKDNVTGEADVLRVACREDQDAAQVRT